MSIRWVAIIAGTFLVGYAAKTMLLIFGLAILQRVGISDTAAMPYMFAIAVVLLIGIGFWLKRQARVKTIIEYAMLAAAALFIITLAIVIGITIYETASQQQASDPGGPAMAIMLLIAFALAYLVQGAICLAIGLLLRRGRRAGRA